MSTQRMAFAICVAGAGVALGLGRPSPARDLARMEQVVRSYVASQQFMGSVLVARDQTTLLDKGAWVRQSAGRCAEHRY
jgi:hypothetical protein